MRRRSGTSPARCLPLRRDLQSKKHSRNNVSIPCRTSNTFNVIRVSLRQHIKLLGRCLSTVQKTNLLKQQQHLESRISSFEQRMNILLNVSDDTRWIPIGGKMRAIEGSEDELSDVDSATFSEVTMTPESDMLSLPSSLAVGEIHRQSLHSIAIVEAELQHAQINDSLHRLRLALGEKAMSFQADVCNVKSQRTSLRAWATVHKRDSEARKHRNIYNHARAALIRLDCCPDFLSTLHNITEQDMKMSGDLTEENRYGQRLDTMVWFWRLDNGLSEVDQLSPRMKECELLLLPSISSSCHDLYKVYRISWLRAKAQYTRWKEEHLLVRHEMRWTVSWFEYHRNMWQRRYEEIDDEASADGLQCYALKQAHLWEILKHHCWDTFNVSLPDVDKI